MGEFNSALVSALVLKVAYAISRERDLTAFEVLFLGGLLSAARKDSEQTQASQGDLPHDPRRLSLHLCSHVPEKVHGMLDDLESKLRAEGIDVVRQ